MRAAYADDERIDAKLVPRSGKRSENLVSAKVVNKKDATLGESEYKLVVELTGSEVGRGRSCGLDLVILLEVTDRMRGAKRSKLKSAINFLIKKLSPSDRLSVIRFTTTMYPPLRPLMLMTEAARSKVEQEMDQPDCRDHEADIDQALLMGLQVLEDRRQKAGRTSAIMLFSDGIQCALDGRNRKIPPHDVPIHTFGVGDSQNTMVLKQIAENSKGTYSSLVDHEGSDPASLSIAFSTCLAGLLTEVVQDLQLTISTKMKINKVFTGSYEQVEKNGSVTIKFGNLYGSEKRTVLVNLQLPVADRPTSDDQLAIISHSFRTTNGDDALYESSSITASVTRTDSPVSSECEGVIMEDARQQTVTKITEAMDWKQKYDGAQINLKEAKTILDSLDVDEGNKLITGLKYEVGELQKLSRNKESFETTGRAFGLASVLSHNMQRFAIRGEADMKLLAYAIPLATVFATQAKKFDKNCSIDVPPTEQDMEKLASKMKNKKLTRDAADDVQNFPITTDPMIQAADPIKVNAVSANESQSLCQKIIQLFFAKDNYGKGKLEILSNDDVITTDGNNGNPNTVSAKDNHGKGKLESLSNDDLITTDGNNGNPIIPDTDSAKQAGEKLDKGVSDPKSGDEKPKISDTSSCLQGVGDKISQALEVTNKCLKALLNLATTLQALLPFVLLILSYFGKKYHDTTGSD